MQKKLDLYVNFLQKRVHIEETFKFSESNFYYFLSLEKDVLKYKKFFKPEARKLHFPKYKKNVF